MLKIVSIICCCWLAMATTASGPALAEESWPTCEVKRGRAAPAREQAVQGVGGGVARARQGYKKKANNRGVVAGGGRVGSIDDGGGRVMWRSSGNGRH